MYSSDDGTDDVEQLLAARWPLHRQGLLERERRIWFEQLWLDDDPPGKLALLYDLEGVAHLLRDGEAPFDPQRDRPQFERYLFDDAG